MFKHAGTISSLVLVLGVALSSPAYAAGKAGTGIVSTISGFDAGSTYADYVELSGVGQLGNCPIDPNTGRTIFRFKANTDGTNPSYNRIYAILITSYSHRNITVTIHTDDSSGLLNGDCTIDWISLNPT